MQREGFSSPRGKEGKKREIDRVPPSVRNAEGKRDVSGRLGREKTKERKGCSSTRGKPAAARLQGREGKIEHALSTSAALLDGEEGGHL